MKTLDLTKGRHSLGEALKLAQSGTLLIHSAAGEDFLLEHADDFDREAAALGKSKRFASFLEARSKETGDIPINQVREKRSTWRRRGR
jgi:hypothetical protein